LPGEWTLAEIVAALSREIPPQLLGTKTLKGKKISFIPWYGAIAILNKYAPGWQWEIRSMHTTPQQLFLCGRLTIPTANGLISREATGCEDLLKEDGTAIAYGDPSSNAESMAFRRACAKFGLGLYLYNK
jgi:hypothetical protein